MRILYSFPQALGAPGVGTTAIQQIVGLVRRGHEVTVVAASVYKKSPPIDGVVKTTMVVGGVRIPHRVLGIDRTMRLHDYRVAGYLRRRASEFDVVHCWPSATLATAKAAAELKIPALREVPNTHTANAYAVVAKLCADLGISLPPGHSHRMNAARLSREEAEYEVSHRLLVPSEHVLSTFLERGIAREKLLRHRYGFDPAAFLPKLDKGPHPFHAVFLGGVEPRKGLHIALEAWRRARAFESARFSIYGRVVEEYRPALAPYLSMPNVEIFDFTDNPASVLQSADALILPSFEEGSALVTYEAQGCGAVPVVSEAAGAQCVHDVSGLIHPVGDIDALAGHLTRLIGEPGLLQRLRAGVLQQRDQLTWDAAAERLERCYEDARRDLR